MKPTILFALMLAGSASAQTPFERTEVMTVDTTTAANVLLSSARLWVANTFRDTEAVIQVDDPVTNRIVGKASSSFNAHNTMDFTFEVTCKTGRCRIVIYDVAHRGLGRVTLGASSMPAISLGRMWDDERCHVPVISGPFQGEKGAEKDMLERCKSWRPAIAERLNSLVVDFGTSLQRSTAADKKDDW